MPILHLSRYIIAHKPGSIRPTPPPISVRLDLAGLFASSETSGKRPGDSEPTDIEDGVGEAICEAPKRSNPVNRARAQDVGASVFRAGRHPAKTQVGIAN